MLRTIKLVGHLGKKFGKQYKFDVNSPAEAVKALCSQVKGFKQYMQEGNGSVQKFKIVVKNSTLENPEKNIAMNCEGDISIVPVIRGSGGDLLNVVAGGFLIASAFGFGPLGGLFIGEFAAFAGLGAYAAMGVGALLVGRGISGMMFKPPETPSIKTAEDQKSYLFNGAVNTTQQGQPIPVGYGRLRVGSQVISVDVSTTQIPV